MNSATDDRAVRRWLIASALAVIAAVALGGITRLTESGLSITVWQPIRGILPPRSANEWQSAYEQFLQIPQAQSVHRGITLEAFRTIYWWEWTHRLLARLVGVILTIPYLVLLWRGAIQPRLRRRLALLPLLAVAQGALGWYMVASGLQVRLSVSPYRLAAHLALALVLWMLCIWTILELTPTRETASVPRSMRRAISFAAAFTAITLVSGALVAGLDAGLIYNTFPRMGDGIVPTEYSRAMVDWRAAFEHPVVVQFHHRVLAIATSLLWLALAVVARRATASGPLRRATAVGALLVLLQVALGIATLVLHVPLVIAVLHQLTGLAVLAAATWAAQRSRSAA